MKLRKILIIHGRTISTLLKSYILAELADVTVTTVPAIEEGYSKLKENNFDVIICGKEIAIKSGLAVFVEMRSKYIGIPIIIVTSNHSDKKIEDMIRQGGVDYIVSPFTARELADKINHVCEPRQWRKQERFHIPGTKAILHLNPHAVEANIVNISVNGMLCDFIFERELSIFDVFFITILFPDSLGNIKVENIMCKYFRSSVLAWHRDHKPQLMRMVVNFLELDNHQREVLRDVFEKATTSINGAFTVV